METLIEQLKTDIKTYFTEDEESKAYTDIIVKEKFDILPKTKYPCIYIEEVLNIDNERYHDETERISTLSYIFTINATQSETLTASQNVRNIASLLDSYFKGDKYRCLCRIGGLVLKPLPVDDTVMTGYMTYTCDVNIDTNTIYRRK